MSADSVSDVLVNLKKERYGTMDAINKSYGNARVKCIVLLNL